MFDLDLPYNRHYMFDLDWRYNLLIVAPIVAPIQIKHVVPIVRQIQIKHVHSSVSYQWVIYNNKIGVVMNRLVGMGLKAHCSLDLCEI